MDPFEPGMEAFGQPGTGQCRHGAGL